MALTKNHAVISSIVILMFLSTTLSFAEVPEGIVKKEDFKIGGASLGTNREALKKIYGSEISYSCVEMPTFCDEECEAKYADVTAYFCDGEAVNISCKNIKFKTPTGVMIGMTKKELFKAQGATSSFLSEGEEIFSYQLPKTDCKLLIHFKNSVVSEIELWFDFC